jgi:hypothetical protein
MRQIFAPLAIASFIALTLSSAAAQTPFAPGAMDSARATLAVAAETGRSNAEVGTRRRHVSRAKTHRAARHHRSRWRNVWVYRAHDRHGYRHYDYVRRKFGGYFAGRHCARFAHHPSHRRHF